MPATGHEHVVLGDLRLGVCSRRCALAGHAGAALVAAAAAVAAAPAAAALVVVTVVAAGTAVVAAVLGRASGGCRPGRSCCRPVAGVVVPVVLRGCCRSCRSSVGRSPAALLRLSLRSLRSLLAGRRCRRGVRRLPPRSPRSSAGRVRLSCAVLAVPGLAAGVALGLGPVLGGCSPRPGRARSPWPCSSARCCWSPRSRPPGPRSRAWRLAPDVGSRRAARPRPGCVGRAAGRPARRRLGRALGRCGRARLRGAGACRPPGPRRRAAAVAGAATGAAAAEPPSGGP